MQKQPPPPAWVDQLKKAAAPRTTVDVNKMKAHPSLLPYQVEAVSFAMERGGRAFLNDEMGLGKTAQALTLMRQYPNDWPVLVVAPKAVLTQWAEEVARWSGRPTTAIVRGKVTRQGKSVIDVKGSVVRGDMKVKKFDGEVKVVITTFDVLKGNLDALRFRPGGGAWRAARVLVL